MSFPFTQFAELGVDLANQFTKDTQVEVIHEAWTGENPDGGNPSYAAPITRLAIVDSRQRQVVTGDGRTVTAMSTLTILDPIESNGASGRREPVDPRDRFATPDGFIGLVVGVGGVIDPNTNAPFVGDIYLGVR